LTGENSGPVRFSPSAAVSFRPWNTDPVDHILSIPDITDADKIAILGGTLHKLMGIENF
jgi:hypothetical protein